jgi:hypothetical protein
MEQICCHHVFHRQPARFEQRDLFRLPAEFRSGYNFPQLREDLASGDGVPVLCEGGLARIDVHAPGAAAQGLVALGVNAVAAATYTIVAYDRVSWEAAGLIAAGSLVGGSIGASVGRRLPAPLLRGAIVLLSIFGIWRIVSG